jgi:hypothetical protein
MQLVGDKQRPGDISGPVPEGRLSLAQHAVLGIGLESISPAGTAERFPGRQSWGIWLDALNDSAYYPIVLVINSMLAAWFFHLSLPKLRE